MTDVHQRTIAFAGLCQSVKLIQEIARDGEIDSKHLSKMLQTILVTNPDTALEVYGTYTDLHKGLDALINILSGKQQKDNELTRYIFGILLLERKLSKKASVLQTLSDRIDQVHRQLQHFKISDPQVLANFAGIYTDVISPLGPKVMISGRQNHIQNHLNQHKIRALLLATMRSAVLWRQLGGKRRNIIFRTQEMLQHAEQMRSQIN